MRSPLFVLVTLLACWSGTAGTRIGGKIGGQTFRADDGPIQVEKEIVVPAGEKTIIEEGTVLLFHPFSGLRVDGKLEVRGTGANPVIFTSLHDTSFNAQSTQLPNPFDWNGIYLAGDESGARMRHFVLAYTVFGIKAETEDIVIDEGIFRHNGQFHFTIFDKIQYVQDNIPYSYGVAKTPRGSKGGKKADTSADDAAGGQRPWLKPSLRYGGLALGLTGLTVGSIYASRWAASQSRLAGWDTRTSTPEEWENEQQEYRSSIASTIAWYALGVVGGVGFGLSYRF
jgi:hypothetical protein